MLAFRRILVPVIATAVIAITMAASATTSSAAPLTGVNSKVPATTANAGAAGVRVMYQGREVSYAQLKRTLKTTYCDDRAGYGKLTCYSSQRAMQTSILAAGGYNPLEARAVARQLGLKVSAASRNRAAATSAAASGCYAFVIAELYTLPSRGGSEVSLFCSYPNLGSIGWSDKAKSGVSPSCQADLGNNDYCDILYMEEQFQQEEVELLFTERTFTATSKSSLPVHP
jgi:hypothetical protein